MAKAGSFDRLGVHRFWIKADPRTRGDQEEEAWPSADYRDAYLAVRARLVLPSEPLTVEKLLEISDAMFREISLARTENPERRQRWTACAAALLDAKKAAEVSDHRGTQMPMP